MNVHRFSSHVPVTETNILDGFSENSQISDSLKIHLMRAEFFHAGEQRTERRTDKHDEGSSRF